MRFSGKFLISIIRLLDKFKSRAFKIVNDTKDIGWDFHDNLGDQFYSHYQL